MFHSELVNQHAKAREYAEEPERVRIHSLSATFDGKHREHQVGFDGESWECDCDHFRRGGTCAHTIAMGRMIRR